MKKTNLKNDFNLTTIRKALGFGLFMLISLLYFVDCEAQISYAPLYTNSTFTKTIDVSKSVGTTAGVADVSSSGAATYSIPIVVPPGTNGVVPTLGLTYSSQAGNGVLGMGWNLSGLSVISRVGQNQYFDGKVSPVMFDPVESRFALDGARLIKLTGTEYGSSGATYDTEAKSFGTITYLGDPYLGSSWFQVKTKEGITMEYGNTVDSRVARIPQLKVTAWFINKIIYPEGNYIEFKYDQTDNSPSQTNSHPRIIEINYTGNQNTGLLPYNKIKFNYADSRVDRNAQYISGEKMMNRFLLESIVTSTENSLVCRTYELKYASDNVNSFLQEIIEKGSDDSPLNSTIIKYGDKPNLLETTDINISINAQKDVFTGDFDGDGYSDILEAEYVYPPTNNNAVPKFHTNIKIHKRTASNATYIQSLTNPVLLPSATTMWTRPSKRSDKNDYFIASDYNGDGRDDIIVASVTTDNNTGKNFYYGTNITLYSANPTVSELLPTDFPLPTTPSGSYIKTIPDGHLSFYSGDFDGDGSVDFIKILTSSATGNKMYFTSPKKQINNTEVLCKKPNKLIEIFGKKF